MPLKLTAEEVKILKRFASKMKPLNLLYTGADEVYLIGERAWAHNIINYLRTVQRLKAEGKTDDEIFQEPPQEPVAQYIWLQWGSGYRSYNG